MLLLPLVSHPGDPGRGHNAFYDLALMVSLHRACHVLLVKAGPVLLQNRRLPLPLLLHLIGIHSFDTCVFETNVSDVYLCLRERERERGREGQSVSGGGAERDTHTESKAGSRLRAVSTKPDMGLELTNHEIKT